MDLRERDHVYDRGRPDPYRRPARIYESPSPSPERRGYDRRPPRFHDDFSDDGRPPYYPDEPRYSRSRPPRDPSPDFVSRSSRRAPSPDFEPRRRYERELEREYVRSPSPPPFRRPAPLRRQSSLDTYDRPRGNDLRFLERREEYGPPARREDIRASYGAAPLPRDRMPRPLEFDDEFRGRPRREHDRFREKEVVRVRGGGKESAGSVTTRTKSSRSSSSSSRETSPSRATSVRSEYPKRGKTKIPGKLVSKRALMDMGYPFLDEVSSSLSCFLFPSFLQNYFPKANKVVYTDAFVGENCYCSQGARSGPDRSGPPRKRGVQEG